MERTEKQAEDELLGRPGFSVPSGIDTYQPDLYWKGHTVQITSRNGSGSRARVLEIHLKLKDGREQHMDLDAFRIQVELVDASASDALEGLASGENLVEWADKFGQVLLDKLKGRKDPKSSILRTVIKTLRGPLHRRKSELPTEPDLGQTPLKIQHVAWLLGPRITVEEVRKLKSKGMIPFRQEGGRGSSVWFSAAHVSTFLDKYGSKLGFQRTRFDAWLKASEL
ncbi:MAG: hypothetical protein KF743_13820 [Fimbriimonadaceae bacterium]|nr:hypothetical protein [Fimbriimonadaceae bacterium]